MRSNPLAQVLSVKTSSDHLWHVNFPPACNSFAIIDDKFGYRIVKVAVDPRGESPSRVEYFDSVRQLHDRRAGN